MARHSMIVPRVVRSSPIRGDGAAAAKALDDDGRDDTDTFDELVALVELVCTPSSSTRARDASQTAKELLAQRKTIVEQANLLTSLRSDLARRAESLASSEQKRRELEGEVADLRAALRDREKRAAHAEAQASRACEVAAVARADKALAVDRTKGVLRRFGRRYARGLADRDRAHAESLAAQDRRLAEQERAFRSELAAHEDLLVSAVAAADELRRTLEAEREALATSVAAHARALASGKKERAEALAERDRTHAEELRAVSQTFRKALAVACAKAERAAEARAAAAHAERTAKTNARLRDAELALASMRAKHEREIAASRLQIAGLREAAAADKRLAQHATDLHARARAELADARRALDRSEREADHEPERETTRRWLAGTGSRATIDRHGPRPHDESGVRLTSADDGDDVTAVDAGTTRA